MKSKKITLSGEEIHPGETIALALPLPQIFSCAPMYMPIKVAHGKEPGPTMLIMAAIHGNELNGTEIINRLLSSKALKKLKGTLICIPIVNVPGFINKSRTLPGGANLNESFPGSETGSMASRIAHLITTEIFPHADICIDLQTGWANFTNLPQVFINEKNEHENKLAKAFGAPVISHCDAEPGSLRELAENQKIPHLVYEAGEAMRFDEKSIRIGLKGIQQVMQNLDMLPTSTKAPKENKSFLMQDQRWVRSPGSGICHNYCQLGEQVTKGQKIAAIDDPFTPTADQIVKAPFDGVLVSVNNLPLVHEGAPLYEIASFTRQEAAASHFENWQTEIKPEL